MKLKRVEAIIRPECLKDTHEALENLDATGMTIYEVHGIGREANYTKIYRGVETEVDFHPKLRVDIIVNEEQVEACIKAITQAARTGELGDGKITVTPVEQVIHIRTGERDDQAMT